MNHRVIYLLCAFLLLPLNAAAALQVFSCEPEWGSLVSELAGDHADVFTATTAQRDPHYIQARPSLIARMRRADLAVCTGAKLEVGWLPVLIARGGNPKVKRGTDGYFEAANFVHMLGVPQRLDRAEGDIHPRGNPHTHSARRYSSRRSPRPCSARSPCISANAAGRRSWKRSSARPSSSRRAPPS